MSKGFFLLSVVLLSALLFGGGVGFFTLCVIVCWLLTRRLECWLSESESQGMDTLSNRIGPPIAPWPPAERGGEFEFRFGVEHGSKSESKSRIPSERERALIQALHRLGWSKSEARRRIEQAVEQLSRTRASTEQISDEELINQALRRG